MGKNERASSGLDAAGTQLAGRLRAVRDELGLSLKQLEKVTASSDSSLSRYFAGDGVPPWPVVRALVEEAGHDPENLREVWESAHRARRAVTPRQGDPADTRDGDGPQGKARHVRWRSALTIAAIGGVAGIVTVAADPFGLRGAAETKMCPWHYVVTDGDPSPVLIADGTGDERRTIGIYSPEQLFYAAEPPPVRPAGFAAHPEERTVLNRPGLSWTDRGR